MKTTDEELRECYAEISLQREMINGARRAASRLMMQNTEMRHALDRIRMRAAKRGEFKDAFDMCVLIAEETVSKCTEIETHAKQLQPTL